MLKGKKYCLSFVFHRFSFFFEILMFLWKFIFFCSVSLTLLSADTFFSHPFLEPSSTIKKCKHKLQARCLLMNSTTLLKSFNLKTWLIFFFSTQHAQCRSLAPPTQWRTVPVAAPHASATIPLLWVWYCLKNPHLEGIMPKLINKVNQISTSLLCS